MKILSIRAFFWGGDVECGGSEKQSHCPGPEQWIVNARKEKP